MIDKNKKIMNSKFDFGRFYSDDGVYSIFAINKSLYSKAQADELFVSENDIPIESVEESIGYVYYGFGTINGEKSHSYWISDTPRGRYPIECYVYTW